MSARPASARPMSALGAGVSGLGAGASYSLAQTAASAGGGVTLRTAHEDEVIAGAGGMRQSASLLSLSLHEGQEEEEAGAQEEGLTARGPAQPLSATQELDALAESNQQEQEYEQQQEAQEASSTLGANEAAPQEDEQVRFLDAIPTLLLNSKSSRIAAPGWSWAYCRVHDRQPQPHATCTRINAKP